MTEQEWKWLSDRWDELLMFMSALVIIAIAMSVSPFWLLYVTLRLLSFLAEKLWNKVSRGMEILVEQLD